MPTSSDMVVENGTGRLDANSYVSIIEADTYHSLRGNTIWASATESDKVVALVRATDYVDTRWKFTGEPVKSTQALVFPRKSEYLNKNGDDVSASVPVEIANATMEYALLVLGDGTALIELSPSIDQTEPWAITLQRDRVGTLETETRYDTARGIKVTKSYPTADRIIKSSGFLTSRGGTIR
jgi:hypothetical protein